MDKRIRPARLDHCAGCNAEVERTSTSAAVIYCQECRRAGLAPSNARHGTDRRYSKGCRCDVCRSSWNERCRQRQKRRRDNGYVRPDRADLPPTNPCDYCGEPLLTRHSASRLHMDCRDRFKRAQSRRRRVQSKLDAAARGIPAKPKWPLVAGVCHHCSEPFIRRGAASPYCSTACRRADAPKPVRPSIRRAVFKRDNWICQLCFEPTEPDADPLSDWFPSVDHIVPRSKGGGHGPENLRCAHRWCNSVRGDESFYSAADLAA